MPNQPAPQLADTLGSFMPLPDVMLLLFLITTFVYIIFSVILYYHWQQYGTNVRATWLTLLTYFVTTIPLVFIMGVLTLTF